MVLIRRNNQTTRHSGSDTYCNGFFLKEFPGVCSTFVLIVCVVFFILSIFAITLHSHPPVTHVLMIEANQPIKYVTDSNYLSIALDSSNIANGFRNVDIRHPRFLRLMSYLSPGYLRIGGTLADRLRFVSKESQSFKYPSVPQTDGGSYAYEDQFADPFLWPNFTMSGREWLSLNALARKTGFKILFDLNVLIRYDNGSWDFRNAEELIKFSNDHTLDLIWELGNEPNSFRHVFNYELNATQLGKDFIILRKILDKYPLYKMSYLVGPDVTRPKPNHKETERYLTEFLLNCDNSINAITWHQYYTNGRTTSSIDFLSPDLFDQLGEEINKIKNVALSTGYEDTPIWLGETASSYGGGAPGYGTRYISSFIWLDKLGLAASKGISLVVKQSIIKGYYALIDESYEPTPNWWVSVLYKILVGPQVLPNWATTSPKVRLYCHCSSEESYTIHNEPISITVFGMNMKETEARIRIQGVSDSKSLPKVYSYILSPYVSLLSKLIVLNDEILYLRADGELPQLKPYIYKNIPYLSIPPYSLAFFVIPSPNIKQCHRYH